MSIIRMAAIPASVLPVQRHVRSVRRPGDAFWWQRLVAEAYPAVGLTLIVGYLLWILFLGEYALLWAGEFSPAE